jgi:hypothetical protein
MDKAVLEPRCPVGGRFSRRKLAALGQTFVLLRHVRFWPKADISTGSVNVRYWG